METNPTYHMATYPLQRGRWQYIVEQLGQKGYALWPGYLSPQQCARYRQWYGQAALFRKTVVMARHQYGLGTYKYFANPLPTPLERIRSLWYGRLAFLANQWMAAVKSSRRFPQDFHAFAQMCQAAGQHDPAALMLAYGPGGHNTLHQDIYGEVAFPLQVALFLNRPEVDYTGGEFVMTTQRPRAQAKAIVLQPGLGDALVFANSFRPVMGTRGYYKEAMRHGVSEVQYGTRMVLGVIFHNG